MGDLWGGGHGGDADLLGGSGGGTSASGVGGTPSNSEGKDRMERLRVQMEAMITEIPVSVEEGEDGGAVGEDMTDFKDWLLVTFRGEYSRKTKSQLVEEFCGKEAARAR